MPLVAGASFCRGMKNRLRAERLARGLSQGELAERMDVSRQTINAVEADKYDPSLPLAYKLAAYFGMPVESLFLNPFRETS
jgi:putative transcriptional regulator